MPGVGRNDFSVIFDSHISISFLCIVLLLLRSLEQTAKIALRMVNRLLLVGGAHLPDWIGLPCGITPVQPIQQLLISVRRIHPPHTSVGEALLDNAH